MLKSSALVSTAMGHWGPTRLMTVSGGLTMRPWRHVPPALSFWAKKRPRIPTQFKYLRSLIFVIAPFGHRQRWRYTLIIKFKLAKANEWQIFNQELS